MSATANEAMCKKLMQITEMNISIYFVLYGRVN